MYIITRFVFLDFRHVIICKFLSKLSAKQSEIQNKKRDSDSDSKPPQKTCTCIFYLLSFVGP